MDDNNASGCLRCQVHDETRGWSKGDLAQLRDLVRASNVMKPQRRQGWDLWAFLVEIIIPEVESGTLAEAIEEAG